MEEEFVDENLADDPIKIEDSESLKTVREGYNNNNTIFGKILQGKYPANVVYEDEVLLCFKDIYPASDLHVLIIPKERITHEYYLEKKHLPILKRMKAVAQRIIEVNDCDLESNDVTIGFHRWPLISVYHLHLHVVFPMPAKTLYLFFFILFL